MVTPERTTLSLAEAAALDVGEVLSQMATRKEGLASEDAATRLSTWGPNAIRTHHAEALRLFARQFRSPLLLLLLVTAAVSFFLGQRSDAVTIGAIVALSVGLGFIGEYRAALAANALHSQIRPAALVLRDGHWSSCDVTELVPGDIVRLQLGGIVPADVRILQASGLECDESILTGESLPVEKSSEPVAAGTGSSDLSSCAFMGTVVRTGSGEGVVVATGGRAEFGRIALGLGERHPETEFQAGLRQFSALLVRVAGVLTSLIFVVNLLLRRPFIDALLFSLAIAVGMTPQLLPAVVTTSLATGSRRLARQKVLVKRLVCIEDLGDIEVLLTDKTGTLTEGRISFERAIDAAGSESDRVMLLGLLCNEATMEDGAPVGGNQLDVALWQAPGASGVAVSSFRRVALVPFDHDRRMVSVLVDSDDGSRLLITKGAPEAVLAQCVHVPAAAQGLLDDQFSAGSRVVAIGTRAAPGLESLSPQEEHDLELAGFLIFLDPTKASAASAIQRLQRLGITVKIVTGDNDRVAQTVCAALGMACSGTLTGADLDGLDDDQLAEKVASTTIFARVSPEQKARIIQAQRRGGSDVAFLGDGVNDALALHHADVGISVDTAADVAKDAADIILLEKDLDVLANGVAEGRRTFANTIKYVLMGTSSNFGNMFSAAAASAFLKFLPMLPSQVLLNNLLYDSSQMAIPTDHVDEEMAERPSHWDISFIRHFMTFFGPISSLFDFLTFAIMLGVFRAGPQLFRSGWFVESLATQTLVIFVIRTRRVPFFRSRPSRSLFAAALACVLVGAALPMSPLARHLGFQSLPVGYFVALAAMAATYLALVEVGKRWFLGREPQPLRVPRPRHERRVHRVAARWSHPGPLTKGP
ncbi:MAG: magnesium-translocating P-type ATPase [Actinomycetota bacterium]